PAGPARGRREPPTPLARHSSSRFTFSRLRSSGEPRLAQVESGLEQAAEPLARQTNLLALGPLDAEDLDRLVRAAIAAEIALRLAQCPQPAHLGTRLGWGSDVTAYSYCSASSTFSRAARRAGKIAARTPSRLSRALIGFSWFFLNSSRVCTFASAKLLASRFSAAVFASLTPPRTLISTIWSCGRGTFLSKSELDRITSPKGVPPFGFSYVPRSRTVVF